MTGKFNIPIKLNLLGIQLGQIKALLEEMNQKLDVLLKTPLKTSIKLFQSSLNNLQHGDIKLAIEELKSAKAKALEALSIFEEVTEMVQI
jgi:hypothetical protein